MRSVARSECESASSGVDWYLSAWQSRARQTLLEGPQDRIWCLTCGAKGTRTPGLLDANHIFCVFLRRPVSPDEPFTCGDCRKPSVGVARSLAPLALCLALLRPSFRSSG